MLCSGGDVAVEHELPNESLLFWREFHRKKYSVTGL